MQISTPTRVNHRPAAAGLRELDGPDGERVASLDVDAIDPHGIGRPAARLILTAAEAAIIGAKLSAFAARQGPADVLRSLGFAHDLGVAWTRELADGTTVVVAGLDEHGEPCEPTLDGPAIAQRLRDPHDHSTLIALIEVRSLLGVTRFVNAWIAAANQRAEDAAILAVVEDEIGRSIEVGT